MSHFSTFRPFFFVAQRGGVQVCLGLFCEGAEVDMFLPNYGRRGTTWGYRGGFLIFL